jgi:hypothetical protein
MKRSIARKSVLLAAVGVITSLWAVAQPRSDSTVLSDFTTRINKYESVKKAQSLPSKQSNSALAVTKQKQQAMQKLQNARPAAHQGDIFSPQIAAYFKRQIHKTLHGPNGSKVQASLKRAEPLPTVHLVVNEKYPEGLPLQSTPPTLLQNLPQLPDGLQYRVVGSTFLIYDVDSDLIVDLILGAVA